MLKFMFFLTLAWAQAHALLIGRDSAGTPIDGRSSLADLKKLAQLDLSAEDAVRIRKSSGYVDCRGRKFGNEILGSGALVGAEDIVVTNAHLFIDEQGRWREPVAECFFQNQDEIPERREFSFAPGDYEIVSNYADEGGANDFAVVRLKKKIDGAKAFPVAEGGAGLVRGMSMIVISAIANSPKFDPLVPVIQLCQGRDIMSGNQFANTVIYGDCAVVKGQSGSVSIAKVRGEWQAVSILAGHGRAQDGTEYGAERGAYSYHVAIRDNLYLAIQRLKGRALSRK